MNKSRDLIGKPLVTLAHGEIIGKVKDVLIDPESYEIAALVLPGKLFSRKTMVLARHLVHVFGKDVILVKSNEVMPLDDTIKGVSSLLGVSKQMKGQEIVTEQGVRIGIVGDVLVNERGKVVSYDLAKVFIEGPLAQSRQIPLEATRSLGPDVIIVDSYVLETPQVDGANADESHLESF
jgi:uncharacterized protein YrrD